MYVQFQFSESVLLYRFISRLRESESAAMREWGARYSHFLLPSKCCIR